MTGGTMSLSFFDFCRKKGALGAPIWIASCLAMTDDADGDVCVPGYQSSFINDTP